MDINIELSDAEIKAALLDYLIKRGFERNVSIKVLGADAVTIQLVKPIGSTGQEYLPKDAQNGN